MQISISYTFFKVAQKHFTKIIYFTENDTKSAEKLRKFHKFPQVNMLRHLYFKNNRGDPSFLFVFDLSLNRAFFFRNLEKLSWVLIKLWVIQMMHKFLVFHEAPFLDICCCYGNILLYRKLIPVEYHMFTTKSLRIIL